jgi:hypothetical protein
METVILVVLVVGALAYALAALRREVKPRTGGGCNCDCAFAEKCTGSSCPVMDGALRQTTEDGRRKTEAGRGRTEAG